MDRETVTLLTNSAISSIQRGRYLFTAALIMAAINFIASYNLYGSWLRRFSLTATNLINNEAVSANQQALLNEWINSTFISIPILGIKIHSSDASFAGSIAIFFFMLATMFVMRRQNHTIGQTARRVARTKNLDYMRYAYLGISYEMVFNPFSNADRPIDNLGDPNKRQNGKQITGIRSLMVLLYFIPALAIFQNLVWDIISIFWLQSPFRDQFHTVGSEIKNDYQTIIFVFFILIVSALCCLATVLIGNQCRVYQRANAQVLKLLANKIRKFERSKSKRK